MNNVVNFQPESGSSLWIQNLVHGLSGQTIRAKHAVFCDSSPFQKIEVFDTYRYGLVLCLGGSVVLTQSDGDVYHEMMVHVPMLMHKKPEKICIIGGGDGGCLKEVLKHESVKSVVVVEIDKDVKETVGKYFPELAEGFKDKRTQVVYDDGYQYLETNDGIFDVILVDSYDPNGPVQSLETADFHSIVSARLAKEGIAVFQTDSPIIRGDFLRNTVLSVSPFFNFYKPYICSISSFPEGICSFLACSKQEEVINSFDKERYGAIAEKCTYYNNEVHMGAFLLPQYIKELLKS